MSINGMTVLFITELSGHGDEGMRNWIKTADRALADRNLSTQVLRLQGDPRWSSVLPRSWIAARNAAPDVLLYVPYSGLTSKSLVRHLALRTAVAPRVDVMVALQSDPVVHKLTGKLSPTLVAFASKRLQDAHQKVGHSSCVLPPVVNSGRFCPSQDQRTLIRERLGLGNDKPMVLHVGHLRRTRGLEPLASLALSGAVNVVMIASTATEPEPAVEDELRTAGVLIKREFLSGIEHWYQAADLYVFPVNDLQGSIEIPLTVLEAMACGTPVASAPFGGLPSLFTSTESLRFAPIDQLAAAAIEMIGVDGFSNRAAVAGMSENVFVDVLENAIERVCP